MNNKSFGTLGLKEGLECNCSEFTLFNKYKDGAKMAKLKTKCHICKTQL